MGYREQDVERGEADARRVAAAQAAEQRFRKAVRRRPFPDLATVPVRIVRLPLGAWLLALMLAGCGGGCGAVWVFDPPRGDGVAHLATALGSLVMGAVGTVLGIVAFFVFRRWRRARFGS